MKSLLGCHLVCLKVVLSEGGKESQVVRQCVSECSVYEMCLLFLERRNKKQALETIEIRDYRRKIG